MKLRFYYSTVLCAFAIGIAAICVASDFIKALDWFTQISPNETRMALPTAIAIICLSVATILQNIKSDASAKK